MHVASMQRCALAVAESTGTASMQRRAPAAAETPKRWCPVAGDPILTRRRSHDETPCFPAVVKGSDDRILQVEVRSGCSINMVSESTAEDLGLDIVIDDFGYEDYIDSAQPQVFPIPQSCIVGLSSFSLFHGECQLWFDGFVIADDAMNDFHVDVVAGAPFMEQNDVSIRPSKHTITFGDYGVVFQYDGSPVIGCDAPVGMSMRDTDGAPERESEYTHESAAETMPDDSVPECGDDYPVDIVYTSTPRENVNVNDGEYSDWSEVCEIEIEHENVTPDVYPTEFPHENESDDGDHTACIYSADFSIEIESVHGDSQFPFSTRADRSNPSAPSAECSSRPPMVKHRLAYFPTEHSSRFPTVGCSSVVESMQCSRPPVIMVIDRSPVCDTAMPMSVDSQCSSNTNPSEGDVISSAPTTSSACFGNVCPADTSPEPHQGLELVIVPPYASAPSAGVSSESDEGGAHPFIDGPTSYLSPRHTPPVDHHTDHVTGPDGETPDDHPHYTDDLAASRHRHHDPDSDVQTLLPTVKHRVLCDPSEQPPAEDAVTSLTDQPPTKDTSEPSHGAIQHAFHAPSAHSIPPVTDHVLALDVDDDRQQTPLADIDSLGLHLPVDDAGPAYCVTHPTWNLPPWTCGPRPPSILAAGGPFPRPHQRAPSAASRIKASKRASDSQAPTQVVADLASVDVNPLRVPWITHPSAPPDSTGLATPPHPPMSPLIPG